MTSRIYHIIVKGRYVFAMKIVDGKCLGFVRIDTIGL